MSNAPCGLFSLRAAIPLVPGGLLCVSSTNGRSANSKIGPAALAGRMVRRPAGSFVARSLAEGAVIPTESRFPNRVKSTVSRRKPLGRFSASQLAPRPAFPCVDAGQK